jgi:predicted nucleic acid-binding protein
MAEKVRNELDGFHFQAGSAWSLANLLRGLAQRPERIAMLQATMTVPPSLQDTAAATLRLYRRLAYAQQTVSPTEVAQ